VRGLVRRDAEEDLGDDVVNQVRQRRRRHAALVGAGCEGSDWGRRGTPHFLHCSVGFNQD
jgi:hypothetical protein